MKKTILSVFASILLMQSNLLINDAQAQTPLWQGKGRIAISSDGNEHDHDDWAATPFSLALLAARGLQDKLVLYTYSDHIWSSNLCYPKSRGMSAYEHMKESALGAKERFGFKKSQFLCAVDSPEKAYNTLAEKINDSSIDNPLIILAGGPMQVVGEAINRSKKEKRQFVTVVSHSWWNNEHSDWWSDDIERPFPAASALRWDKHEGWNWDELKEEFGTKSGGSVKFVDIVDQNGGDGYEGLSAHMSNFEWLLTFEGRDKAPYQKESWYWLYTRLLSSARKSNFDVSDSGMVTFILTGNEKSSPEMARKILENPIIK